MSQNANQSGSHVGLARVGSLVLDSSHQRLLDEIFGGIPIMRSGQRAGEKGIAIGHQRCFGFQTLLVNHFRCC